jgi:hypothetical protein
MTTTIELAKEAGFADWYGTDDIAFLALLDIFRTIIVAARDRELLAGGCECGEVARYLRNNLGDDDYADFSQSLYEAIAAARLQGAEEERKRAEVFAKHLGKANLHIRELEQHLAEKREPLTDEQDRALCESNFNAESDAFFEARPEWNQNAMRRIFYAGHRRAWISKDAVIEAAHNIGGNHD